MAGSGLIPYSCSSGLLFSSSALIQTTLTFSLSLPRAAVMSPDKVLQASIQGAQKTNMVGFLLSLALLSEMCSTAAADDDPSDGAINFSGSSNNSLCALAARAVPLVTLRVVSRCSSASL